MKSLASITGPAAPAVPARRRRLLRGAAALSAVVAVLYALIATHVVQVIDGPAAQVARDQLAFATPAVVAYLVGAALLLRYDRRTLWLVGAILQGLVIAMYFNVAPKREPAFEVWGISIRVVQTLLLAILGYLAVTWRAPSTTRSRLSNGDVASAIGGRRGVAVPPGPGPSGATSTRSRCRRAGQHWMGSSLGWEATTWGAARSGMSEVAK